MNARSTSHPAARVPRRHTPTRLGAAGSSGWWGGAFVVLLLLQAGMFSAPTAAAAVPAARNVYAQHPGVVVLAQAIGLLAAVALLAFGRAEARAGAAVMAAPLRMAGAAVAGAAALTCLPPLWLAVVAGSATDSTVRGLLRASDLTDVLLFAAITVFSGVVARAAGGRLRPLAAVVAAIAAARSALLLAGSDLLGAVAPSMFVVLMAALVARSFRGSRAGRRSRAGAATRT